LNMPKKAITGQHGYPTNLVDTGDGTFAEESVDATGSGPVRYTTDTTAVTGSFAQVMCLTATTFSKFDRTGATGSPLVGLALPAGTLLIGPVTAYTLASGAVAAYS
jgi:hypothetical protein